MTDEKKAELELLARRERERQGGGHLPVERLTAYRAGELTPEEIEEVQDHLAVCRVCTAALLEIPRFEAAMEGPEATAVDSASAERTDAAWKALRARLPLHPASAPLPAPPPAVGQLLPFTERKKEAFPAQKITFALAAALTACLIGFPAWMATHRAGGGLAPQVLTTAANSEVTRGTEDNVPLQVQSAAGVAVLVLPLPEGATFPSYRIEIRTPAGDLRLTAATALTAVALPPPDGGAGAAGVAPSAPPRLLTLALSPERLPAGEYRLRIVGMQDGRGETLAEHPLRIGGS